MEQDIPYEMRCEASLRDRMLHVVDQWETSLTFFCLVFGFFVGLVFALNPFLHTIHGREGYGWWPLWWLFTFGIIQMALTAYAALYPERHAAYMAITFIAGIGLITAFHPFSVIGVGFWVLALVTVGTSIVRRLQELRRWAR